MHDPGFLQQQLNLLMTAYGYNLYNETNRARADDQLVRQKVSGFLGDAANRVATLAAVQSQLRATLDAARIPSPSAEVMQPLKVMDALRGRLSSMSSQVRGLSTPTQDQTWARFRNEKTTLHQLLSFDYELITQAEQIAKSAELLSATSWQHKDAAALQGMLHTLEQVMRQRETLLTR